MPTPQIPARGTYDWYDFMTQLVDSNSAKVSKGDLFVSVKDYGATGDGVTDDQPSIQAALDGAGVGGAVYFPPGTYRLGTASTPGLRILKTYPGQSLTGAGRYVSVLKVGNNFGDYQSVISTVDGTHCGRWTFSNLGIDQNATGGNALSLPVTSTNQRMAIRVVCVTNAASAGSAIIVANAALINGDTLNGLYIAADTIDVSNNHFVTQGGPVGTVSHDHSTIFTVSTTVDGTQVIGNNTFRGVLGSGGSRTAIETHAGCQTITGNTISGYSKGMNITGQWSVLTDGIACTGNTIRQCVTGIHLWSYYYGTLTSGTACRNVTVANNTISVDRDAWASIGSGFLAYGCGIMLDGQNSAPAETVKIVGNSISYSPATATQPINDYNSSGIKLIISSAAAYVSNLEITGNTIDSPIASGIFLSCVIKGGRVSDNVTRNPTQNSAAQVASNNVATLYRAGIVVQGTLSDVQFERNQVIDDRAPHYAEYNIVCTSGLVAATGCSSRNNVTRYADGVVARCAFVPAPANTAAVAFLIEEGTLVAVLPAQAVKPGSTVKEFSTGKLWTQVTPNTGTAWLLEHKAAGSPEGVVTAAPGSRYMRTDGAAGSTQYVKESGSGNTGWVAK